MCSIFHKYGKGNVASSTYSGTNPKEETDTADAQVMVPNKKGNIDIAARNVIFSGANFTGGTMTYVQINQK